jgi:hypothetical protein
MDDPDNKVPDRMETIIERMERLQERGEADPRNVSDSPRSCCVANDPEARETLILMVDECLAQMEREQIPNSEEVRKFTQQAADFKSGGDLDYPKFG